MFTDTKVHRNNNSGLETIVREIHADLETPISVYLKLRGLGPSFLLESVEGGDKIARYSFLGIQPCAQYLVKGHQIKVIKGKSTTLHNLGPNSDPTNFLQAELEQFQHPLTPGLPRFVGGLVGYMSYECVRFFEPTLKPTIQENDLPDAIYLMADTLVAFDHASRTIFLIANVLDGDVFTATKKIDEIAIKIQGSLPVSYSQSSLPSNKTSNMNQAAFEELVIKAKKHIECGDIFQIVLSQRFDMTSSADPFEVYRMVRRLNPSPYMFFFDFGQIEGQPLYLVGASPEMFVRLEGRTASLRPIAGTRKRSQDFTIDNALASELLNDPKEQAEHVMLVDLGRNDLGRVCEYGSVKVTEFSIIERYSHVMHLVSHVEGILRDGIGAFDLVRAAFPAGTVSGAPKVRAMQIISELETDSRGPYAGMVGYFGFDGAMDTCLAIRTMVGHGQKYSVQAGAGIVADSIPSSEYQETINKASAMLRAIELAESNS